MVVKMKTVIRMIMMIKKADQGASVWKPRKKALASRFLRGFSND